MRLSVIIPNYNGGKTIEKCIKSIYTQKIEIEQLIVVDDASTDNSVRLVKDKFPEVNIIEHSKNYGAAKARNDGIKKANGDSLLFVDSDVYLSDFCIKTMSKYINESDITYPTVLFENGSLLSPAFENEKKYIRRSPVFMIKRDSLDKLDEFFDESYGIYYEDIDFFARCYLAGLKCQYVHQGVAYHSVLPSHRNLEKRFYLETKNKIYCMLKFLNLPRSVKDLLALPTPGIMLLVLPVLFSNRNIYSGYPDHADQEKLSSSRLRLFLTFLKAISWNVFHLTDIIKRRQKYDIAAM